MSLEKASIVWNSKQLSGMIKSGKINFDHVVQRSFVWEKARKSALIESMIIGYPIPSIYAKRVDADSEKRGSNVYYIMDGKQRLSTIKEFLNDEFTLTSLKTVVYIDEETLAEREKDISDLKFSELPESLKSHLNTTTINVVYFDNLTKNEECEMFKRLNAGKPLSTKSRLLASSKDIESLLNIGNHVLFHQMLSEKSRQNKNQVSIIMKIWCMMNKNIEDICFESKVFNSLIEKTIISETEKEDMIKVFDLIVDIHDALIKKGYKKCAKKTYTETHMISLIPYLKKSIETNTDIDFIVDWIIHFFENSKDTSISEAYNEACGSGLAKNINIVKRNEALYNNYIEFFNCK